MKPPFGVCKNKVGCSLAYTGEKIPLPADSKCPECGQPLVVDPGSTGVTSRLDDETTDLNLPPFGICNNKVGCSLAYTGEKIPVPADSKCPECGQPLVVDPGSTGVTSGLDDEASGHIDESTAETISAADGPGRKMRQIFISYRAEDSLAWAERLADRLEAHVGGDKIFRDIRVILSGEVIGRAIEMTVGACDVLIAVIGAHWLTAMDEQGDRRLHNPKDFVRMEIAAALKRDLRVIPVLLDHALMPQVTELPDDLKPLVRRNALRISDFDDDCRWLIAAVEQVLDKTTAEHRQREEKEQLEIGYPPIPPCPVLPPSSARRPLPFERMVQRWKKKGLEAEWGREVRFQEKYSAKHLLSELPKLYLGLTMPCLREHWVDCSVFAPARVRRKQRALLQVFLHCPYDRALAEATASKFDSGTGERGHRSLDLDAPIGTTFAFDVEVEGFVFPERMGTLLWTGQPQSEAFVFVVPGSCKWGQHIGCVRIWKDGTPVGRISFQIEVVRDAQDARQQPLGEEARHYRSCFCSYSSLDRVEMLKRAQGLRATGLKTFVDVMELRPGDIWNPKIFTAIDESDLFVVIWSKNAHDSKWVKKESRYALRRYKQRGSPDFRPIPVEGPRIAPVPRGLRAYHFDDEILSLIRAAELERRERGNKKKDLKPQT